MANLIPPFIKHIHLIAICGTGMGSLAGLLKQKGYRVTGSDENIYPPMSLELQNLGVPLFSGYHADHLNQRPDLVVVGNAVSKDNPEVVEVMRLKLPYLSMPQALSHFFLQEKQSILITGTHGKTTTSAVISHLLNELGENPSFFVGGVLVNFGKNYQLGEGKYFVIEGDEYDTAFFDKGPKFLHYHPYYTIITSLEFDHADIYRDLDHLTQSFEKLINENDPSGFIVASVHYPRLVSLLRGIKTPAETYGFSREALWEGRNLQFAEKKATFDVCYKGKFDCRLTSPMVGRHNSLNILVSYVLLKKLGFDSPKIQSALSSFLGVKRRQEVRGVVNDIIVMDDFAHHPTAVRETLEAVRQAYPSRPVWALFEPRSNTSMRDIFQEEYAEAFMNADHVVLADVYRPQKVKEGKILDVDKIVKTLLSKGVPACHLSGVESLVDYICQNVSPRALLLVMSNGAFGGIHDKLLTSLGRL